MGYQLKSCFGNILLAITLTGVTPAVFAEYAPPDDTTTQNPSDNIVVYDKAYTLNKTDSIQNNTITIPSYDKENNKLTEQKYNVELKKYDYGHTDVADEVKNFHIDFFDKNATYSVDNSTLNSSYANSKNNTVDTVAGDFVDLSIYPSGGSSSAGITNNGTINLVDGNFVNNSIISSGIVGGGGVRNIGIIDEIQGDFIHNHVSGIKADGGAIYNTYYQAQIHKIVGDFIGNYSQSDSYTTYGGAIYNGGTIDLTVGNFIANHASGVDNNVYGGAIYNYRWFNEVVGDFIANYASGTNNDVYGGAIYNDSFFGFITGDFIANYATGNNFISGGAIYNTGTIESITGDFINNHSSSTDDIASSGAIYNRNYIQSINGDFLGNYAEGNIGAEGGAITNLWTIDLIDGDFIGNYAHANETAIAGAIANYSDIDIVSGDFISNSAISNTKSAIGGAIANLGADFGCIDGSFIGNYVETNSDDYLALGGAIYTTSDLTFISDNDTNIFSGNYTQDKRGKINNAIFVDFGLETPKRSAVVYSTHAPTFPTLTFNTLNNGIFIIDDTIDGGYTISDDGINFIGIDRSEQYQVSLKGDTTGAVVFNNDVINARIDSQDTNVFLGRDDVFNQSQSLSLDNTSLSMINNSVGSIVIPEFNLDTISSMKVDVDLLNEKMDTIKADDYYVEPGAKLNVSHLNLLNDANKDLTLIQFTDNSDLASATNYTGENPVAYSPIYKYDVGYDNTNGIFSFTRGEGSSYTDFNPSVVTPSTVSLAGAYSTQMQTFNYAFQHSDNFMNIPYLERIMLENKNKYAYNGDVPINSGVFSPIFSQYDDASIWVKPYTSFENIPLKNGPEVSNISYGTLIGFDSKLKKLKNGFGRVLTGYVGYNGASQSYSNVDSTLNGGLLGGTATFYKGNFFNATTLSVGANHAKNTNMYGSDDLNMILGGVGNKTGYNFEFKNGKVILQPNLLLSYTFVNTFDYTNSAGVKMKSDPLHAIQIAPGVKLIGNFENGWQPYLGVSMVWNIIADSKVMANDVVLPEMSIKPYVQYGVGVQKRFKDRFQGFLQAMVQNGGRNGVSLSAGFRWAI